MLQRSTEQDTIVIVGGSYLRHGAFKQSGQTIGFEDPVDNAISLEAMIWEPPTAVNEE